MINIIKEIELTDDEEEALHDTGKCPLCGVALFKHESQYAWEEFVWRDGGWVSLQREVNEVSEYEFKCSNKKCDFVYEHPG